MHHRSRLLPFVFFTQFFVSQLYAAGVPVCDSPWTTFPEKSYRPLLELEPKLRAEGENATTKSYALPFELRMEQEERPIRAGKYTVSHVPIFELKATSPETGVYFYDKDYQKCQVRPEDLSKPEFRRAFAYSGSVLQLFQGDTLKIDVKSSLDYTKPAAAGTGGIAKPDGAPYGGGSCEWANLHVHGLLVRASKKGSKLGDYIYDAAVRPGASTTTDPCQTAPAGQTHVHAHGDVLPVLNHEIHIPGRPGEDQSAALQSGHHPSGLFWYHPHIHGYSAQQLTGGTTGLITVGKLSDYTSLDITPSARNVRFFMIKDMQINASSGRDAEYFARAKPDACDYSPGGDDGYNFFTDGECQGKAEEKDRKWLFTINGIQRPEIVTGGLKNSGEVWRIANASPTVSYHLSLIPMDQVTAGGKKYCDGKKQCPPGTFDRLPFNILSKDGAGFSQTTSSGVRAGNIANQSQSEKEILLMPGARVEILLKTLPIGDYALVTEGVKTGGDKWPRMVLATLKGDPQRTTSDMVARMQRQRQAPRLFGPRTSDFPTPGFSIRGLLARLQTPKACGRIDGWERVIYFVKNPNADKQNKDGPIDSFGLVMGLRRPGVTDPAQTKFFRWNQISEKPTAGRPVDLWSIRNSAQLIGYNEIQKTAENGPFTANLSEGHYVPSFGNAPSFSNVCIPQNDGYAERWVIENWSNEIHNFHLHQTRFLIDQKSLRKPGFDNRAQPRPEYFRFPCASSAYDKGDLRCDPDVASSSPRRPADCAAKPDDPICKTTGYADELIQNFFTAQTSRGQFNALLGASVHDSVPIPRGTGSCDGVIYSDQLNTDGKGSNICEPGRVTLIVPFQRKEQIGTFVYHCHILEHEDRGMMATIQVYDPANPDADDAKTGDITPAQEPRHSHTDASPENAFPWDSSQICRGS